MTTNLQKKSAQFCLTSRQSETILSLAKNKKSNEVKEIVLDKVNKSIFQLIEECGVKLFQPNLQVHINGWEFNEYEVLHKGSVEYLIAESSDLIITDCIFHTTRCDINE